MRWHSLLDFVHLKLCLFCPYFFIFLKTLFIFREGNGGRKKERENYQYVVASHVAPTGDLARNPGMRPDWEANQRPFRLQASTQSTEPTSQALAHIYC